MSTHMLCLSGASSPAPSASVSGAAAGAWRAGRAWAAAILRGGRDDFNFLTVRVWCTGTQPWTTCGAGCQGQHNAKAAAGPARRRDCTRTDDRVTWHCAARGSQWQGHKAGMPPLHTPAHTCALRTFIAPEHEETWELKPGYTARRACATPRRLQIGVALAHKGRYCDGGPGAPNTHAHSRTCTRWDWKTGLDTHRCPQRANDCCCAECTHRPCELFS